MANTTSGTILSSGSLHSAVSQEALRNFMARNFFMQFGKEYQKPRGNTSVTVYTPKDMSAAISTLTEGETPTETLFTLTPTVITTSQYGGRVEITDVADHDSPLIDTIREVSYEMGGRLAQEVDQAYQDTVDAGTNVIYSATEDATAGRTNVDDGDTITLNYITEAASRLSWLNARPYDGEFYVAIMHPHVAHDLKIATAGNGRVEVNKYTNNVSKIFRWELGVLNGVRIVESSNVQFYANASDGAGSTGAVDVYPTFVFGEDAFGHAIVGWMEGRYDPFGKGDDFLRQRANVSVKMRVGFSILRQNSLYRIESSSSIGTNA